MNKSYLLHYNHGFIAGAGCTILKTNVAWNEYGEVRENLGSFLRIGGRTLVLQAYCELDELTDERGLYACDENDAVQMIIFCCTQ